MNITRLKIILQETTRLEEDKSPEAGAKVVQLFQPPRGDHLVPVDCSISTVLVDPVKALHHSLEVAEILKGYPKPKRLYSGPTYIEVGHVLGAGRPDTQSALRLFAFGKVVDFWSIRTPKDIGITGVLAKDMVNKGFIVIHTVNMEA